MSLLKKTNDLWQPSEKPNLKIGETLEVTNYETLVKTGMAVLVDQQGNELELPGQVFTCPICFETMNGVMKLTEHLSTHLKKNKENLEDIAIKTTAAEIIANGTEAKQPSEEAVKAVKEGEYTGEKGELFKVAVVDEPKKLTRAEILAKARAARKAKKG